MVASNEACHIVKLYFPYELRGAYAKTLTYACRRLRKARRNFWFALLESWHLR
jgi:hypothetical protein